VFAGNLVAQPQSIQIDVVGISLNKVLFDLSKKYGIQLAFDDNLLSKFNITTNYNFTSVEAALDSLMAGLPLNIEKSGEVYMIIPAGKKELRRNKLVKATGQVVEAGTFEPLPFSYILINNRQIQSDLGGNFTFLASSDTSYNMQISHLGYFIYDTVFTNSFNRKFHLKPSITQLGEIDVLSNPIEKSTMIGDKSGRIKLNHSIAPYLPGYGDNSVFNFLRLMPGIQASGEQSAGLLIWGSYDSHSKVDFDGFTLFGLKNFNDNIGVVNPLVLKNMEVLKGGYEAKYGDKVGGIVNIVGKNGSLQKPTFTFNINNTTINSMIEVPVSKKSSILAAYRQTYYELYDPSDLNLFQRRNKQSDVIDFTLTPDYNFKDANLKYSFQGENTTVNMSLYVGGDRYSYDLESEVGNNKIARNEEEKNLQIGGSAFINQTWKSGNTSSIIFSYSGLTNSTEELNRIIYIKNGREKIQKKGNGENIVEQYTISQENRINFKQGHFLEFGIGFQLNDVLLTRNLFVENLINMDTRSQRIFSYIQDNLPVNDILEIKAGLRANYLLSPANFYLEPRFEASMKVNDEIKLNVSYGIYHQFLSKTSLVDSTLNYYYFWANSDNNTIPVLKGEHWVGGLSYNRNGFTISAEGFYKKTDGLSRFINGTQLVSRGFYTGEGRSYGLDFYFKTEFKNHLAWVSYTLSKSEELFPFNVRQVYRPSPQDQRHEIKFAGILNFNSFYISANYVYGSGFEKFVFTDNNQSYIPNYSRLDGALIYKFKPGKINGEAGISILNILNTENIKFNNLRRVATGTENPLDVHAEAIPFTPTLFLKLKF